MTRKREGMTRKRAGMTGKMLGMTEEKMQYMLVSFREFINRNK